MECRVILSSRQPLSKILRVSVDVISGVITEASCARVVPLARTMKTITANVDRIFPSTLGGTSHFLFHLDAPVWNDDQLIISPVTDSTEKARVTSRLILRGETSRIDDAHVLYNGVTRRDTKVWRPGKFCGQ